MGIRARECPSCHTVRFHQGIDFLVDNLPDRCQYCNSEFIIKTKKGNHDKMRLEANKIKSIHDYPNCEMCGGNRDHVHHIKPIRLGGTNDKENLLVVCIDCHCKLHPDKAKGMKAYWNKVKGGDMD